MDTGLSMPSTVINPSDAVINKAKVAASKNMILPSIVNSDISIRVQGATVRIVRSQYKIGVNKL